MKNSFGSSVQLTLFGESHAEAVGAVLDGIAPGIPVDESSIAMLLEKRRPASSLSAARREPDAFRIVSGVYQEYTTGSPLCILIPNTVAAPDDYRAIEQLARPGHADYTAYCKFHGFADARGGGHFSGRLTAAIVAVGGILLPALHKKGIQIGTHIACIGGIPDKAFSELSADFDTLVSREFPVLDEAAGEKMREAIRTASLEGDSVGGILETAVTGFPAGVGEPWFDTVEGVLSHALFSIPAVKGVEFGSGFKCAAMRGSEMNDAFYMHADTVHTRTNHNGGINGGISNGEALQFRIAVKPTPSIKKEQNTVDWRKKEDTVISVAGRHDACIVPRAAVVADSVTALVLCDLLAQRYGTDWLGAE